MRQAFNLLKQHKLFSGIYILGTALTIAMTMTMFIIFYVKFGPIYPEQHRDRMLVVGPLKRYPKGQPENYNIPMGHSVRFANEYLAKLSHVEAIATVNSDYGKQEVSISDERKTDAVVTATNEGFWRVFGFNFIAGHPYSRKDVASHAKVAVVCRSLAQEFWATTDAVGRTLTVRDSVQVKVVGVVDDCSLAATSCYSQIWIPMQESDTTIPKFWESNHLGGCKTYLLCDKKRNIPLIQQEAESMLARINKADKKDEYSLMGQPDTFAKSVLRTDYTKDVDVNGIIRGFLYILLTVLIIPSLNLSGMISSRMNSRLPELGIRKAYGASNRQLLFQVLNENFLLTAAGSVAGLVLSLIIVYTCSEWVLILFDGKFSVWTYSGVETMVTPDMLFNPWVLVATVSVCLVLNTASALIPAWIALRKTIIESILGNENKETDKDKDVMKLLFHQIWNQRKLNSWIFLELLIVSCFLWITIDPLFVIVSNRAIPTGMNLDRVYYVRLDMAENIPQDIEYKKIVDMFHHELNTVKELPEIEDFCVMDESSEICGRMWNGAQMFSDTTDIAKDKEDRTSKYVHGQSFSFPANYGDLCQLYGMTDAVSGKPFVLPKNAGGKVVISESAAKLFFGKTNVVGRSYYHGNKKQVEVCGVVKDIKYSSFSQPYPTEIEVTQEVDHNRYMYELGFRLKEGVDSKEFKRRFEKDVMPKMKTEVFSCSGLYDVDENIQLRNKFSGHINKMRLQSVLIGFALLSIFLGMLGTFWMRCNARRAEIGLMRSIGASKRNITNRCLLEAAILTTIAFVLIVPVMYLYADANGFYMIDEKLIENGQLSTDYPQNRFGSHFALVTTITYVVLLGISLLGTYIPATLAARMQPADVLKDE